MNEHPLFRMEEAAAELRCIAIRLSQPPFTDDMLAIAFDVVGLAKRLDALIQSMPEGQIIQIGRIK